MKLTADLSLLSLITGASLIVQLVLALLLFLSMWSWWQIFQKMFVLSRALKETNAFEDEFWAGADLNTLFTRASQKNRVTGALERVFEAGFREFAKHKRQASTTADAIMDSSRRAMRAACQRELDALERHLAFLASVGSVSPYIGLFGTVWGIMNAFRGISNVVQATLAHVAPGIAEALIATAMGLFAAIPAVLAYNSYSHDVDRLATRYDSFMEEFSNILQRQPNP